MIIDDLVHKLEATFELDEGSLNPSMDIEDIPGWSSFNFLKLIATVEEEYRVRLAPSQVLQCLTLGNLGKIVSRQMASERFVA